MIDDVDADGIVLVQDVGNLQLGAYRVSTGHQNWLFVAFELKKPPKEPDAAQDLRAKGRPGVLANQLRCFVSSININPSLGIGFLNFPASSGKNPT